MSLPPAEVAALELADAASWNDLGTFVARARRVDPDGAARLSASAGVLATYVSPLHGRPGPTVIGLRTSGLADRVVDRVVDLDITVPLSALGDRLAVQRDDRVLEMPPTRVMDAGWAGITPPRSGWVEVAELSSADLIQAAGAGVAEVSSAVPEAAGPHVVSAVRGTVWGRTLTITPLPTTPLPTTDGPPAGVAFVADALGFLDGVEPATLRRAGPWWRLTTSRGHVLARAALL